MWKYFWNVPVSEWKVAFTIMGAELLLVIFIGSAIYLSVGQSEPQIVVGQPTRVAVK